MKEIAVQFGPAKRLVGILSMPQRRTANAGVILMNAGIIHRIGPHRWNVKLARELASAGCPVLRMDLSGLGGSGAAADALPHDEQAVADLRAAMDYMSVATGARAFMLAGICSGAWNSFNAACADSRVAGVWMMDEFAYPTRMTAFHLARLKLEQHGLAGFTWRLLRRTLDRLREIASRAGTDVEVRYRDRIGAEEFAERLRNLIDRGVRTCLVYSAGRLDRYSYHRQFADRFGSQLAVDAVAVHFLPSVNHTLMTLDGQRQTIDLVLQWVATASPSPLSESYPASKTA